MWNHFGYFTWYKNYGKYGKLQQHKPETRNGFTIRGEVIKMRTHQNGIQTTHGGS